MTMNNIEVTDLLNVLEHIREGKYPDIPQEVIQGIVYAQFEKQDDRTQARKDTKRIIDEFIKSIVDE